MSTASLRTFSSILTLSTGLNSVLRFSFFISLGWCLLPGLLVDRFYRVFYQLLYYWVHCFSSCVCIAYWCCLLFSLGAIVVKLFIFASIFYMFMAIKISHCFAGGLVVGMAAESRDSMDVSTRMLPIEQSSATIIQVTATGWFHMFFSL